MKNISISPLSLAAGSAATAGLLVLTSFQGTLTPERIFTAMEAKAKGKEGRFGPDEVPDTNWPRPRVVPPPWEGGDGREVDHDEYRRKSMGDKAQEKV